MKKGRKKEGGEKSRENVQGKRKNERDGKRRKEKDTEVMWDVFLYTVNMCCFYWLMNTAALAHSRAEYSWAGNPSTWTGEEGQGGSRKTSAVARGVRCQSSTNKPWVILIEMSKFKSKS